MCTSVWLGRSGKQISTGGARHHSACRPVWVGHLHPPTPTLRLHLNVGIVSRRTRAPRPFACPTQRRALNPANSHHRPGTCTSCLCHRGMCGCWCRCRAIIESGAPPQFGDRAAHSAAPSQVWDSRATGPNDALAECCIDLKLLYMNLMRLQKTQEVERQLYDMTFAGESRHAKLDMSVELLPRHEAEKLEALAGLGRSAPNQNPYLARPQRRAVDSAGSRGKPKSGSS